MQKNRISRLAPGVKKHAPQANGHHNSGADFDSFVERSLVPVEQGTVFEFIRHIPHDWKAPDIERFADKTRRMAEALGLPFHMPGHDRLGGLRVYPVAFMQWIYKEYATQFGWPAIVPAIDDGKKKRANALRQLDEAVADAPQNVRDAMQTVTTYLECVTGGLNQQASETSTAPVLRPV